MELDPKTHSGGVKEPQTGYFNHINLRANYFPTHYFTIFFYLLNKRTRLEVALRLCNVSQSRVRGVLQLLKPGQVLLLGLVALFGLQRPLQR